MIPLEKKILDKHDLDEIIVSTDARKHLRRYKDYSTLTGDRLADLAKPLFSRKKKMFQQNKLREQRNNKTHVKIPNSNSINRYKSVSLPQNVIYIKSSKKFYALSVKLP